jgi:hypothetical protein
MRGIISFTKYAKMFSVVNDFLEVLKHRYSFVFKVHHTGHIHVRCYENEFVISRPRIKRNVLWHELNTCLQALWPHSLAA